MNCERGTYTLIIINGKDGSKQTNNKLIITEKVSKVGFFLLLEDVKTST